MEGKEKLVVPLVVGVSISQHRGEIH